MNRVKLILVAASLMLAMAITISCSSDKDEGGSGGGAIGSCNTDLGPAGSICLEYISGMSASDAKTGCEMGVGTWSGGKKCPSGAGLSCPFDNDGVKGTTHLYGAMASAGCEGPSEE